MYRSILAPLDGSAFGEQALPLALGLARRAGAALHLVHVHVPPPRAAEATDAALRMAERGYLEGLAQRIAMMWDVPITSELLDGPVVPTLHGYAGQHAVDLIVISTHGRTRLSRLWLGSIADTLIREVTVPVLLVRPQEQPLDLGRELVISHILVPLDGSALAEQILAHATALGRLTGAGYTLLQVVETLSIAYGPEAPLDGAEEPALGVLQAQAQTYLDRVAAGLREAGLQVQTATVVDQAAGAILEYAQAQAVSLIALETHGRSGLKRWIFGGVADKVIRGATVPVLLHRPQGGGEWLPAEP
jgi:nucleotide-binding universal stress UspA family protein